MEAKSESRKRKQKAKSKKIGRYVKYVSKSIQLKLSGNNAEDTPVPIPNTEVKLRSADDTWREAARESRKSLRYTKKDC